MNSIFSGPQFAYLIVAVVILGLAFGGIVWVGRMIRGELGAGASGGGDPSGLGAMGQVPPAVMKEAIARGLVVPSQLAGMSEMERTFLFASLKQKLSATAPAAAPSPLADAVPISAPPLPPARPSTPSAPPPVQALPPDLPAGMAALLNAEKLRVWCPMCGTELQLPTFPPMLARCSTCGMKSAVRSEAGGRFVINISPPPKQ